MRTCIVSFAYPPSTTPLEKLQQITLSQLKLETNHTGKALIVRTFDHPLRHVATQNIVEDKEGNVGRLSVYNLDPSMPPKTILPKGAIFTIKEPYYKATADGGYSVRVDHPSDLLQLDVEDPLVPAELAPRLVEIDRDAAFLKKEGTAAYLKGDYLAAVKAYTKGLAVCTDQEASLRFDLYRNRAIVNLYFCRYEYACSDALVSLIPDSFEEAGDRREGFNSKALYRAGRAEYHLENFTAAKNHFEQALTLTPEDGDCKRELVKTKERLQEQTKGIFDFTAISNSATAKRNKLDHASYLEKVEVRAGGVCGRGLFARCDIKAGDVILVEKAYCVAFSSETSTETYLIMNLNTNRMESGTHATRLFRTVGKMLYNQAQAKRLLDLGDGGYSPKCTAQVTDGVVTVDTFQTQAILERKGFGCPTVRSCDDQVDTGSSSSTGVWITASYINHACAGNAWRSFIGDLMIVRASKDVSKGSELFMPYAMIEAEYNKTQETLQKTWGFICDCTICGAEKQVSSSYRKLRQSAVKDINAFLADHRQSTSTPASKAAIDNAVMLYSKMESTYTGELFKLLPRIGLVQLSLWICTKQSGASGPAKVVDAAITVLRNLGCEVQLSGPNITIDRTHGYLQPAAVHAVMYAAQACFQQGKLDMYTELKRIGKEMYVTLYGELRAFGKTNTETMPIVQQVEDFLNSHPHPRTQYPSLYTIYKAEKLCWKLEREHDDALFNKEARPDLIKLSEWLALSYLDKFSLSKVRRAAIDVLINMGYGISQAGTRLKFDRTNELLEQRTIDAAMYAAYVYYISGWESEANQLQDFAEELYKTAYGESRGFKEMYGIP
ncbi:hypothetical protein LTR37_001527 [Vermiconidia calcicola]|uniref:Uncharacterized protein n=1 Tax=Vermiconidia calcicola TaxID=1690605 RepID=A0ACC3NVH2_9PEZI|nr:hypothetical protein LTR37_001527 [Vermiconidia calcicola]